MEKTYDFVIKPLKNDPPPGNHGKHIFFLEIELVSQLKKFEKNLSSASVDDERP